MKDIVAAPGALFADLVAAVADGAEALILLT
ncbi:hypothetical protein MSIMFB_01745 [Mycobacterium simulans]|uniref:Uncharacterized protein n=1 Tax=Mycobacterium simulans TaxID=627089 RepID=A0A7Z7N9X3_9MYCO|nr:hypothetical protein MSIMFB_01745 [Mycobacterium simulans]